MHASLAEVIVRLDEAHAALFHTINLVPSGMHARRPATDRWSANEVVEHLALVERYFSGLVASALAEAQAVGLGEECDPRVPLSGEVVAIQADRTKPRTAPEPMHPTGTLDRDAAWTALDEARARFREMLIAADGLALGRVVAPHRAFGPLTAYQWVELVAAHERRHTEQIKEIARQFGVPA